MEPLSTKGFLIVVGIFPTLSSDNRKTSMGMDRLTHAGEPEAIEISIAGCCNAPRLECETTTQNCPVADLRATLASAHRLLRASQALVRKYEYIEEFIALQNEAVRLIATLTPRQHEVMDLVLVGTPSKNIAADLHISQRTVENHRAAIMKKTGAKSLPGLGCVGFAAALNQSAGNHQ
jgi:DNA-binding CsgD family transcriptional regulator